jgi:transposase
MIALPTHGRVYLACGSTDMRRGFDGLAVMVQEVQMQDPHSGALFAFKGKRGRPATFCIRFAVCDDCLSLASIVRANAAGLPIPPRQGIDVHLYARAARSLPRAAELDVRRKLLRRY